MNRDDMNTSERDEQLRAALSAAYEVDDAPDSLRQRVALMAQNTERTERTITRRHLPLRLARGLAAMALISLIAGGTLAWRYYFGRAGETAIQLIPADAALVVTLDTTPSAAQTPLFLRIKNALQTAHIDQEVDGAVKGLMQDESSPISASIRPYLTTSFAFAMLNVPTSGSMDEGKPVVLLAINDANAVDGILARTGQRLHRGDMTYYRLKKDDQCAMLLANYLVFSTSPDILVRIQSTYQGRNQSVASLRDYQDARQELPEDANVMAFVSPAALAALNDQGKKVGIAPFHETKWLAASATLRDDGIAFDYRAPASATGLARMRQPSQFAAIDTNALKLLPAGPYGLFALSDPAAYWDMAMGMVGQDPKGRKELDQGVHDFESETGFSVTADMLPAFRGRTWFAVYPNPDDANAHPEGLIVIDDANHATPAALSGKVRAWLERITAEKGKPGVRFTAARQGDTTIWRLDDATKQSLNEAATSATKGLTGDEGESTQHKPSKSGDWAPAYAEVGNSVVIATSDSMLFRALAAHQGLTPTLADATEAAFMRQHLQPGTQGLLMVQLSKIMRALEPHLHMSDNGTNMSTDDLINLFGNPNLSLVATSRSEGGVERANLFLPLDYDRAIRLIGKEAGTNKR
jgi:hypothetical protein